MENSTKSIIMLVVALLVVVIVVPCFIVTLMYFSYNNKEAHLRNLIVAQQKVNEAIYDEMWKDISQVAQVAENYKDSFKEIYPAIMQGRYGNARGGALMSWVKESNITFSTSLYEKLANIIEAKRAEKTNNDKKIEDLAVEHNDLLTQQPAKFFVETLGGKQKIEIKIVTSTRTDNAFKTGKDDDVSIFTKKK